MTPIRRHLFRSVPMLLLALAAASAQAADNYLKVIPGTALAWGAVNHMNEANEKIQKLATVVQAPVTNALEQIKTESGVQKGLDEKGAAGFFVLPGKTEKDPIVAACFVAVADEKEFLGNFEVVKAGGKISEIRLKTEDVKPGPPRQGRCRTPSPATHCVAFRNGYALVAPKSDRAAVEAAVEGKQDVAAEMAGLEAWLAENDGIVVSTAAGIKYAAKQAGEELKKSKDNSATDRTRRMAPMLIRPGFYGTALEAAPKEILAGPGRHPLRQAGLDPHHRPGAAGRRRPGLQGRRRHSARQRELAVRRAGRAVRLRRRRRRRSQSGRWLHGPGHGLHEEHEVGVRDVGRRHGADEQRIDRGLPAGPLDELRDENRQARRSDLQQHFCAMHVENSQRLLDLQEKYAENVNKLMQNAKQGILKSMTAKRLEIAGKPALQQEMNFDLSSMAGPEASRAILDEMMGVGGKMLVYYVAADEHTVLMGIGVSQERMAAALDVLKQPKKSLAEDADVSVTAAMLPADSQWVAYSVRGATCS